MRLGALNQHPGLVARAFGAEQLDEGRLVHVSVLTHWLAEGFGVAEGVEEIVDNLEGEAEIL